MSLLINGKDKIYTIIFRIFFRNNLTFVGNNKNIKQWDFLINFLKKQKKLLKK